MQYIYFIKNKVNDKFYVGRTNDIGRRKRNHLVLLRKNNHHSTHLQNAWNKYGEHNFEFIIHCELNDENELETAKKIEQEFIDNYISTNNIYNRSYTSNDGVVLKGKDHPHFGKHPIEWFGEAFNIENNRKKTLTGDKNHFYGKKHSLETKIKCGERNIGRKVSKETREKLSNAGKGREPTVWQSVKIDDVIYKTISEASKILGINRRTIRLRALDERFNNYCLIDK